VVTLLDEARSALPAMVELRRQIHRRPELGLDLPETQAVVVDELERLGLSPRRGRALSSVTAVIGADRPGRTVVLRADMDGLPMSESTGLDFASELEGRMHACGHDMHVAMLLGAARLLVDRMQADQASIPGPVLLMFQPGEEGFAGARVMLEEGLLQGVDRATARGLAIHVSTRYSAGEVHGRPGAEHASADNFFITVRGRGGHASMPDLAADPIPVAAEIILALQSAVTRSVDLFDPVVVTIGHVVAGTTHNVIPDTASLEGTFRCVSDARRAAMPGLIRRVVEGVAGAHGLSAEIRFEEIYPVTLNDPAAFDAVHAIATDLLGEEAVQVMDAPAMPADDWSFVLQQVPGVMVYLGTRPAGRPLDGYPQTHSNTVVFDEQAMAVGAALHAKVALEI
jgi:hippurate hydrolase